MAIFMPSSVTPDVRSGLGLGVVDVTQGLTVSWRITGSSALTSYQISILTHDADSTQLYTTGQISTGCPAYGTTSAGMPQFFSYSIGAAALSSAGITNGNEYKLIITQWWSVSDSVTQASASVFVTRATPTLSIQTIGTGGVIATRNYTFTGVYAQAQGDVLNWFRWEIEDANGNTLLDTGNISGTMDISCSYDGFFTGESYAVRLSIQTENGAEVDTGWVSFSASYPVTQTSGEVTAGCVGGTDAVLVEWSGIGYIPGTASGEYSISDDELLSLPAASSVEWNQTGGASMSFASPWSVIWKGTLGNQDAVILTVGQSGGDITLNYTVSSGTITLKSGSTTLVSQSGFVNVPTVTAVLTAANLYLRCEYMGGGLYPSSTLYPSTTLYPAEDTTEIVNTYTLAPSYTQDAITSVSLAGYQVCEFLEVIQGDASAATIQSAITNGNYVPGLNETDYMMADWSDGIDAGTLDIGGDTLQGFSLYRRQGVSATLVKVADTDAQTERVFDYGALSQQGPYTYYLFPVGTSTYIATPLTSGMTMPVWWNWTLMECAATSNASVFTVLAAYRFRLNLETGAVSNNNTPNLLNNFTPYPKVQLTPQNYKSGSLTGLIGAILWENGEASYMDTIALENAIFALSVTQNPLFLKNRKGELIRVRISGPVSMQTDDATKEQTQTMTLPWVETGSAAGVSLYASEYVGVQEPEGVYTPQFYVDASDATANAENLRILKTAYGADGKMEGGASVSVNGDSLILPQGMEE